MAALLPSPSSMAPRRSNRSQLAVQPAIRLKPYCHYLTCSSPSGCKRGTLHGGSPTTLNLHVKRNPTRWLSKSSSSSSPYDFFSGPVTNLQSPAEVALCFYVLINGRDPERLGSLLSADCVLEDTAFSRPFNGSKDVQSFLNDLMAAMGENLRFVVESVSEGKGATAAVLWHLEWKGKKVPFTKGSSFYECQRTGEGLLIKKARIITESPLKPGKLALELLKVITSIFDRFPSLANRILDNPDAIVHFIRKIYKILIEPFIVPVMLYYTSIWTHAIRVLRHLFNLLLKVLENFM